ncbi:MAG: hypothetical protein HYT40_00705, partial [Candidatus Sungbacteria bacterium]|nr:hypothetical protein [Candidatus Sungbacteria bacterium]
WTVSGLKESFGRLEVLEVGARSGPWSALLVFLAYWLGNVCSFGPRRLAPFMGLLFMLLFGPLKIFDFIFGRIPGAEAVSAHLYILSRKSSS